jgi:acetyl-CoA/propionyl-CoA carboxylase biotin carboxyl carrier protein
MFTKVLVANRGEIALRVMRTLREMGIRSVAVHSDPDFDAPHTLAADEAFRIGPAPASESYLNIPAILEAAKKTGAQAIHPGYGFLAENPRFVKACDDADVVFIGPSAAAMDAMGDKSKARGHAAKADVPTVPGIEASDDPAAIERAARGMPLPLLLKAAAGGGGKGMRKVEDWGELHGAIEAAMREGKSSFGDPRLIVESYIHPVRHVEVQVVGDGRGHVIALGERECSLQRRHQKIIEESPSTAVDPELRTRMMEAACRVSAAVKYGGAGTVEFLLGPDGKFYFLEMNTRLQVEHPVTEFLTGLDLVEMQLRVAAGEGLPIDQSDVRLEGHAIEARLYAENAEGGFLPTSGTVLEVHWPNWPNVRIDSGIKRGQQVGVFYDPLIAKIISWSETRERATRKLVAALEDTAVLGLVTNQGFLIDLLESEPFRTGETYTQVVEAWAKERVPCEPAPAVLAAAVLGFQGGARGGGGSAGGVVAGDRYNPWKSIGNWRIGG